MNYLFLFVVVFQHSGSLKFESRVFTSSSAVEEFSKDHHVIDVHEVKFNFSFEAQDGLF